MAEDEESGGAIQLRRRSTNEPHQEIWDGDTHLGWVTPAGARRLGSMMGGGMGGGRNNDTDILATGVEAGAAVFEVISAGELDRIYEKGLDERDRQLQSRTRLVTEATRVDAGLGQAMEEYFEREERTDMYLFRAVDIQFKCLWASAIAHTGSAVSRLMKDSGGRMGDATAWVVGGVAVGAFLLSDLFDGRSPRRRNRSRR